MRAARSGRGAGRGEDAASLCDPALGARRLLPHAPAPAPAPLQEEAGAPQGGRSLRRPCLRPRRGRAQPQGLPPGLGAGRQPGVSRAGPRPSPGLSTGRRRGSRRRPGPGVQRQTAAAAAAAAAARAPSGPLLPRGDVPLPQCYLPLPLQGAQGHGPGQELGHQEDQGGVRGAAPGQDDGEGAGGAQPQGRLSRQRPAHLQSRQAHSAGGLQRRGLPRGAGL